MGADIATGQFSGFKFRVVAAGPRDFIAPVEDRATFQLEKKSNFHLGFCTVEFCWRAKSRIARFGVRHHGCKQMAVMDTICKLYTFRYQIVNAVEK